MGISNRKYGPFLILCLAGFATFFCSYLRIPVLPLFAASLGADPARIGMINGAFMLATGVLSVPAGLLADRLGRRIPATGGILLISLSSLFVARCQTPGQIAAAYVLFGAGLAAFAPSMLSLVADTMPSEKLGRAYGWYTTGIYAAMTLGPAAGGLMGKSLGLRQVFNVSGVMLLVIAAAAAAVLPRTRAARKTGLHAMLAASVELLGNRRLTACLVATAGNCFGFGVFLSFFPLYAAGKGLDAACVGIIFGVHGLTNVLCRIPVGLAADRVDRCRLVAVGLLMFAAGLSATGLSASMAVLTGCAVLLGGGMALTFTALGALVAESVSAARRGLAMGMFNSCIYLGLMAGSAGLGIFIAGTGYPAGFAAGAVVVVVTLACFGFMLGRRQTP